MSSAWSILTTRIGSDINSPSPAVREAILDAVSAAHSSDVEHTDISLRYGHDEGPMYVLIYAASQSLRFEQWADQDFEAELAPAGQLSGVNAEAAFEIFSELRSGQVDSIKQRKWAATD